MNEIPTFAVAAGDLKTAIRVVLLPILQQFRIQTGLTPSGIDISMIEISSHGDAIRQYGLGNVGIRFDV